MLYIFSYVEITFPFILISGTFFLIHFRHTEYVDEQGRRGIRIQFYLQGVRKRGTAQLDAREVRQKLQFIFFFF